MEPDIDEGRAEPDAPPIDLDAPDAWPVTVEKHYGWLLFAILASVLAFCLLVMLPELTSGIGLANVATRTPGGAVAIGVFLICALVAIAVPKSRGLTVDSSGIAVRQGSRRAFYAWGDIESLDIVTTRGRRGETVRTGVQVSLRGRSPEQNKLNVVPGAVVGGAEALRRLLTLGWEHFGKGAPGGQSNAPGDDLRGARMRSARMTALLAILPILLGVLFTEQGASNARNMIDLQKHGRPGEAVLLRTFQSCGKYHCDTKAQFRYQPAGSGRSFTGIDILANNDRPDDPNLVYAKTHATLPIAYDPRDPTIVSLNLDGGVFIDQTSHYNQEIWSMHLISLLILAIYAILVAPLTIQALLTPRAQSKASSIVS